jgi:hypothetical protein
MLKTSGLSSVNGSMLDLGEVAEIEEQIFTLTDIKESILFDLDSSTVTVEGSVSD